MYHPIDVYYILNMIIMHIYYTLVFFIYYILELVPNILLYIQYEIPTK